MAGYAGKRMSNNAVHAYLCGKMPLSKWTKKAILEEIQLIFELEDETPFVDFSKMTKQELADTFLCYSEWHHTGVSYNKTVFFEIDRLLVLNFNKEKFEKIIESRKLPSRQKKEKAATEPECKEEVLEVYKKLEVIFNSKIVKLKTFNGLIARFASGKIDLEAEYKKAIKKVAGDYLPKIKQWEKLPKDHSRQKDVILYKNDLEHFIRCEMCSGKTPRVNSSVFKKIKNAL